MQEYYLAAATGVRSQHRNGSHFIILWMITTSILIFVVWKSLYQLLRFSAFFGYITLLQMFHFSLKKFFY